MKRWGPVFLGFALVAACHEYRTDPGRAPVVRARSAGPKPAPTPAPREWIPSEYAYTANPELAPGRDGVDGGAIIEGLRVDATGRVADEIATPALAGGTRVPRELGGGFLFWSGRALYTAKTFAGSLEPFVGLPSAPARASFGPGYTLLHFRDGARWALALSERKRIAMPVVGLVDAAGLPDGRGVILVDPDIVLVSPAGKTTWRDATREAQSVTGLVRASGALWLTKPQGHALRLEPDGTLVAFDQLPEALRPNRPRIEPDPRWPVTIRDTPLVRAVQAGVPIDAGAALVEAAGAFVRVNLASGAIAEASPRVLTGSSSCELLPVKDDVLAVCRNENNTSAVVAGAGSGSPRIEKVFQGRASFFSGAPGTLAYGGPCDGPAPAPPRNVVCVRSKGKWRELGEPPSAADAGASTSTTRRVVRWIPTADGNALGLVSGADAGLFDAAHDTFTRFTSDAQKHESGLYSGSFGVLADDFSVDRNDDITGYLGRSALTLHKDGSVDRAPYDFTTLVHAGAAAVAVDRTSHLWQSRDFGRTWSETKGPPGSSSKRPPRPDHCSRAGCSFGRWLRIGWAETQPNELATKDAPAAPQGLAPVVPRLECSAASTPHARWVTRSRDAQGRLTEEFDFGAKKFHIREEGAAGTATWSLVGGSDSDLRAASIVENELVSMTPPRFGALVTQPRVVRYAEPFGESKVVESRFVWQDVLKAGAHGGEPQPPQSDQKSAAPVLSSRPGASDGLLLVTGPDGVLLWARAGKPARLIGDAVLGDEPRSAEVRAKDELVALVEPDDCSARIAVDDGKGTHVVLELPRRPSPHPCPVFDDALATAADGTLAVLRIPSTEPSTKDDPALLLRPGQQPLALAPWSTLTPLDSCPKDFSGWRAVIHVGPWLALTLPGVALDDDGDVLAAVRWNEQRVCVEAVEMSAGALALNNDDLPLRVSARFADPPSASLRGFALGAESEQALTCKLEH